MALHERTEPDLSYTDRAACEIGEIMNRMEIRKKQFGILSKMLGFVIAIMLVRLIGDLGMAYFSAALEMYILLQMLFTAGIPDCMARMIRSRMAKGQFKNAGKVTKAALGYCLVIGVAGSFFLLLAADPLMRSLKLPEAALTLKILAAAFFLQTLCVILQGYFQGMGSAMPSMVFGIIKQVFCLSFSLLFAHIMHDYGQKASALLHNEKFAGMYGACGAAIGFPCALLLAFCFLFAIYIGVGRRARRKNKEGMRLTEDGLEVLKLLLFSLLPTSGILFFLRLPVMAGMVFYLNKTQGDLAAFSAYGAYYGKYLVLVGIFSIFALLAAAGVENTVVSLVRKEENKNARNYLKGGMQSLFLLTVYFAMLLFVLAPGMLHLFFGKNAGEPAAGYLQNGFVVVLFLPMGIYFINILMGIGKSRTVLLNILVSFILFLLAVNIGLQVFEGGILALVYAVLVFTAANCLLNGFFLLRMLRCKLEWLPLFVLPAAAAVVSGICIFLLNKVIAPAVGDALSTLFCILLGGVVYLILLFVLRCIREEDLDVLPCGSVLQKIGMLLHLL